MERKTLKQQGKARLKGFFNILFEFLDELKNKDIYDNSTMIITADHGSIDLDQHSILFIKEKDKNGDYSESSVPVSAFDIPLYIMKLVGTEDEFDNLYGEDIRSLNENQTRTRHLFRNASGSSNIIINEYVSTSFVNNAKAMTLAESYKDPLGKDTPYELGTELKFNADATGNRYSVEGFGANTGYRTILRGPVSTLEIPFAKLTENKDIDVYIKLSTLSVEGNKLLIYANDEKVFEGVVDKEMRKHGLNFVIPKSVFIDNTVKIDFVFPEISENELNEPVENRTVTISFVTIRFE